MTPVSNRNSRVDAAETRVEMQQEKKPPKEGFGLFSHLHNWPYSYNGLFKH